MADEPQKSRVDAESADAESKAPRDPAKGVRIILHLCVAAGLVVVLASGISVALALLPTAVNNTTARVWIGIGLFGLIVAGVAAIALYVFHAVGQDALAEWLSRTPVRKDERGASDGDSGDTTD
jgi:hypothetical protein